VHADLYEDEAEAIAIANDTPYGLQAYVISSNPGRVSAVARQIEAGRVVINGASHDPAAPFGGFKQSGIGREYGVFGLQAYLEPKAILGSINASASTAAKPGDVGHSDRAAPDRRAQEPCSDRPAEPSYRR
jgi:hypothetical protein